MKIRDLYPLNEDEGNELSQQYNTDIKNKLISVLMLFKTNGVEKTNVNNIINELNKKDIYLTKEQIKNILNDVDTFSVDGNLVYLNGQPEDNQEDSEDNNDENVEKDLADNDPNVSDQENYNPAKNLAKQATQDRLNQMLKK